MQTESGHRESKRGSGEECMSAPSVPVKSPFDASQNQWPPRHSACHVLVVSLGHQEAAQAKGHRTEQGREREQPKRPAQRVHSTRGDQTRADPQPDV